MKNVTEHLPKAWIAGVIRRGAHVEVTWRWKTEQFDCVTVTRDWHIPREMLSDIDDTALSHLLVRLLVDINTDLSRYGREIPIFVRPKERPDYRYTSLVMEALEQTMRFIADTQKGRIR